jgi:peptidoglycan/LPS O-acetylase OafA/YrhL
VTHADGIEREEERAPRRLGKVPALDGLRAIAVLLVVIVHFRRALAPWASQYVYAPAFAESLANATGRSLDGYVLMAKEITNPVLRLLFPDGGFLGVDIFFVLSGFLITALMLREASVRGRVRVGAFYRRRALRLLPALFAYIAAQMVYAGAIGVSWQVERRSMTSVVFYYFNWNLIHELPEVPPAIAHLWSLSVEEQFYLVWPLLTMFVVGIRHRLPTVVAVLGGCVLAIAAWRWLLLEHHNAGIVYFRTDARADSLLVGALAAHLWVRRRTPSPALIRALAWPALAFIVYCVERYESTDPFLARGGFTIIAIAVAIVLLAAIDTDWSFGRVLRWAPLRGVGRVSYGLYLWHVLAFGIAGLMRTSPATLRMATGLALMVAMTATSWYVVELPFLRWKDRLEARLPAQERALDQVPRR